MKVQIIVTDDNGNTFEGSTTLSLVDDKDTTDKKKKDIKRKSSDPGPTPSPSAHVNLSSPLRPFVKKHARNMGGPQKFALIVAHLTKGKTEQPIALSEVQKNWNKMKVLLGGKFNPAYTIRAKEHEWVDSPKVGQYVLLPGWKGIFDGK
jgi:hypothetical protein